MKNTEMVRSGRIMPILLNRIKKLQFDNSYNDIISEYLFTCIQKEGERGLINYLAKLEFDELSSEHILLLDSLRSVIRYATKPTDILDFKNRKIK